MSRHVIVSDSWWFISKKSLASNNFRQISIGLLVKTLGVGVWGLSQRAKFQDEFLSRLELIWSFSFMPPVPQHHMGKIKAPNRIGYLVVWAAVRALCSAQLWILSACKSVYVPCYMASGFEKECGWGDNPKGRDPHATEKHVPSCPLRLPRTPAKAYSDQCAVQHTTRTTQIKDAFRISLECNLF